MKRIIKIIAAMAVIASLTGCVTPYLTDRVHDAADVFTVAVSGGGGAKARVGPVHTGLIIDIGSYGLRSGEFGEQGGHGTIEQEYLIFPVYKSPKGKSVFSVEATEGGFEGGRGKNYNAWGYVPFVTTGFEDTETNPAYFTQIEVVGGFGLVLRLGFNPGELLDFVLGWATVDIYGDDSATKNQ